jgi:hypothetical protein
LLMKDGIDIMANRQPDDTWVFTDDRFVFVDVVDEIPEIANPAVEDGILRTWHGPGGNRYVEFTQGVVLL